MNNIILAIKKTFADLKQEKNKNTYTPIYRVVEILENEEAEYTIHIQLIGKGLTFYAKPEEILADDKLVDQFSPRDIRTLTYLGYLGINSPKYKILAKRLVDDEKIVFAIKKKGEKEVLIKTAAEILSAQEIISKMHPNDAKAVGYIEAKEDAEKEKKLKADILNKKQGIDSN